MYPSKSIPFIIAGNKSDLVEMRDTSKSEVSTKVEAISKLTHDKYNFAINHLEISAKTGEGVNKLFDQISNSILDVNDL